MIQDPEAGLSSGSPGFGAFSDRVVRAGFIRKVYGILSVQLSVTTALTLMTVGHEGTKQWFQENGLLCLLAAVASLPIYCCLICGGFHRAYPINIILLGIITACQAISVAAISAMSKSEAVIYAIVLTTVIVMALTLFAFQTKIDFTRCYAFMFVVLIVFITFGFIMIFFPPSKTMHLIFSVFGSLIFAMYIIIDTQMIIGGSHSRQFSPEDYVLASLFLYIDIINLFLNLLSIMNNSS